MLKVTDKLSNPGPEIVDKLFHLPKYKDAIFESGTEVVKKIREEFGVHVDDGSLNKYFRSKLLSKDIERVRISYNRCIMGLKETMTKFKKLNHMGEEDE